MAHFDRADRGVYEPGEDVRVFDGSEDEEDAEGSRLPLLIVLALLVLVDYAGYKHQLVQAGVIVILAVTLFLLQRFWVFRDNSNGQS